MDSCHALAFLILMYGSFFVSEAKRRNYCEDGKFGYGCISSCNCRAEGCDGDGICDYGCAPAWSGTTCNKKKAKPTITYQCLNPDDDEKQMKMTIQTHGIFYRDVSLVDENKKELGWCWDTDVSPLHKPHDVITVKIRLTSKARRDMRRGTCGGKIVADNVYEWMFTVQEWKKVSLGMEENIQVRCNFTASESQIRHTDVVPNESQTIRFTKLQEVMDNVSLVMLDGVTRNVITTADMGHPVILQMRYGTPIKSITPYNCYATTANHDRWQEIVDYNGCEVTESPVKPFVNSKDPNAVETPWFPYFAYSGSPYTQFRCSYKLCYDKPCTLGCTRSRHIRSASHTEAGIVTTFH